MLYVLFFNRRKVTEEKKQSTTLKKEENHGSESIGINKQQLKSTVIMVTAHIIFKLRIETAAVLYILCSVPIIY